MRTVASVLALAAAVYAQQWSIIAKNVGTVATGIAFIDAQNGAPAGAPRPPQATCPPTRTVLAPRCVG